MIAYQLLVALYRFGRKPLFMIGFIVLPIRGVLVAIFHKNIGFLLATQILDGLGDGTYGVMHQVIEQLTINQ
jgi:hypothetical protein